MRVAAVDRWSRGASWLHRRDPRAKTLAVLVLIAAVATLPVQAPAGSSALIAFTYSMFLLAAAASAKLPAVAIAVRAAAVLPLTGVFAAISWMAGDRKQALTLLERPYVCALAALLLISTTPLPALLNGLERMGAPRIFGMLAQFLYRYLFVIAEQARRMRQAAACRRGRGKARRVYRMRAAAGAVAVLFARSYARAEGIHRAMLARGFSGRFAHPAANRFCSADAVFLGFSLFAVVIVRLAPFVR